MNYEKYNKFIIKAMTNEELNVIGAFIEQEINKRYMEDKQRKLQKHYISR